MKYSPFAASSDAPERRAAAAHSAAPFDEAQLAAEIACALQRRRERSPPTPKADRWLGDEADAALVAASATEPVDAWAGGATSPPHAVAATSHVSVADAPAVEPTTLAWVKTAQRQRRHARLRGVAGWVLTLVVSLIVIAASGIAVLSWSGAHQPSRLQSTEATAGPGSGRQAEADPQQAAPQLPRSQMLR